MIPSRNEQWIQVLNNKGLALGNYFHLTFNDSILNDIRKRFEWSNDPQAECQACS